MYLSNKLFRSRQPSLNLNLPEPSTQQDSQVCLFTSSRSFSSCQRQTFNPPPPRFLQVPQVSVTSESGIPRDASGAIDYNALALLLKDTQNLQDQADILYILFKDK